VSLFSRILSKKQHIDIPNAREKKAERSMLHVQRQAEALKARVDGHLSTSPDDVDELIHEYSKRRKEKQ